VLMRRRDQCLVRLRTPFDASQRLEGRQERCDPHRAGEAGGVISRNYGDTLRILEKHRQSKLSMAQATAPFLDSTIQRLDVACGGRVSVSGDDAGSESAEWVLSADCVS
jgi:hypothetical protein